MANFGGVNPLSFNVLTTLAAQRIVAHATGTAHTVIFPPGNQSLPMGITVDTVLDTTSSIAVAPIGSIAKCFANDTFTAGSLIASDSSGRAVPFTLANTTTALTLASAYVGYALEGCNATGTIVQVYITPGFDRE